MKRDFRYSFILDKKLCLGSPKTRSNIKDPISVVILQLYCIFLFGLGSSCSQSSQSDNSNPISTLERLKKQKSVKVGFANEAPYAYLDLESQRLTGEAPEIARVILKKMGVDRIEGVLTEFGSLIPGLKAKRFDIIAAGMYITPERAREIIFSNPSYGTGEAFIVKTGNPLSLHSYGDVAKNPKARMGVVTGTVEKGYAQKMGIPDNRVLTFPDPMSAVAGVKAGRVDVFAGTSLTIQDILTKANSNDLERALPFSDPIIDGKTIRGYGAFGFRKEDTELADYFNQHLAEFIGSPEHLELVRPFNFTENELPGEITAAELSRPSSNHPTQ